MFGTQLAIAALLIFALLMFGGLAALLYLGARRLYSRIRPMADRPESNSRTEGGASRWKPLRDSLTARSLVIGILALLMLVPLSMVGSMVWERHRLYNSVLADIAGIWGGQQTLEGPVLVVPYVEQYLVEEKVKDEKTGEETTTSKTVFRSAFSGRVAERFKHRCRDQRTVPTPWHL